jgi:hypothetical protein
MSFFVISFDTSFLLMLYIQKGKTQLLRVLCGVNGHMLIQYVKNLNMHLSFVVLSDV